MDEVKINIPFRGLIQVDGETGAKGNPEVSISFARRIGIAVLAIRGQNYGGSFTEGCQSRRQCSDDIGQSSGLGKRRGLGSHHQDIHQTWTPVRMLMLQPPTRRCVLAVHCIQHAVDEGNRFFA